MERIVFLANLTPPLNQSLSMCLSFFFKYRKAFKEMDSSRCCYFIRLGSAVVARLLGMPDAAKSKRSRVQLPSEASEQGEEAKGRLTDEGGLCSPSEAL